MSLGTMGQRTEGMKKQANELIEQAYQRGYKAGQVNNQEFHESICDGCKKGFEDREMELIEYGRTEAWEAARKIVEYGCSKCNVILGDGVIPIENRVDPFIRLTAAEAISKIKAYEEQKKQEEDERIKVGDEVRWLKNTDCVGIVTYIDYQNNMIWIMSHDGRHFIGGSHEIEQYEKTGHHFSDMDELIKKMQEG